MPFAVCKAFNFKTMLKHEDNPKSIKYYVKRYILNNKAHLKGKKAVDFPAGNGITSRILKEVGAEVTPLDLFPEYFEEKNMTCIRANIKEGLPLEKKTADFLICQEGIEHFSDQYQALKEFNRILKTGGTLLITTPNYSNIRSRLSYFLTESERFGSIMPPNELDSIWMTKEELTDEIYFGHIFLIGIQKLRVLAKLSGFKIKEVHFTRKKSTSTILFPFFYPFIWLSNYRTFKKNMRKNSDYDEKTKREIYTEIFQLGTSRKILIGGDLMVEFVKEKEADKVAQSLKSQHKSFGLT